MQSIVRVINALSTVRLSQRMDEAGIHREIMSAFDRYGIRYQHEYKVVSRKRFDFWLDGVVIEVKKQKPSKITLLNQVNRYTRDERVKAVIVVLEETMVFPRELNGKPVFMVSLNINWGIAI